MIKISFIVVTYNSEKHIANCLHSIEKLSHPDKEIFVLDNSSTDNTVRTIENTFKNVTLIKSDKNLGFAEGCNTGYQYTTGELIALVNPDVILDKDWLVHLFPYAVDLQYFQTGIFASKMININSNRIVIDTAGDGFSPFLKAVKRGEGENINQFNTNEFVFGACAGAALYRRKMIDEIGFFDTDFFLIYEDTDLNFRAQLAGWKVLYVASAVVYHKVRSSIGHMSDAAIYYSLRNSAYVRIKNIPAGIFFRYLHAFLIGAIAEFFYFAVKHKRPGLYFKAKKDALKMLPQMLRKRKEIMKNRKVSTGYIKSVMTPVWHRGLLKSKVRKLIYG